MDVAGRAEGDRVVGVRVAHGWDADTAPPLVLLQLRTDPGDVGFGEAAECDHDVEAATVAEHADMATDRASCLKCSEVGTSVTKSMMTWRRDVGP